MIINKRILVKYRTFITVKGVCETYSATWSGLPGYVKIHNHFVLHLGKITDIIPDAIKNTLGTSALKQQAHDNATELGVDILDILSVTADEIANKDLAKLVLEYHKKIYTAADAEFVGVNKNIFDLGTDNLSEADDYGLTQAKIDAHKVQYELFETLMGDVAEEQTVNKDDHANLVFHIAECSKDLIKLKKLMSNFKTSHDFYDSFLDAAKYQKLGFRKLSFAGYLRSKEDNKPIAGATIVLTDKADIELHLESSLKGKITVRRQPENVYYMSVTKVGKKPIVDLEVILEDDLTNDDDIFMEKL